MAEHRSSIQQSCVGVRDTLDHIAHIARHDLPFALRHTRLAQATQTLEELERALTALYRLSIERRGCFLPDLVDGLMRAVENALDNGISGTTPWREVL